MTYQQVRDVVETIRGAHQQMRDALEAPRTRTQDRRTETLLAALRQEEQQLQLALARFGTDGSSGILDTWLQYVPDEELRQELDDVDFSPEMTAEDIVGRKLQFDQALIALLGQLTEETAVPRVQELFQALLDHARSQASDEAWGIRDADLAEPGGT